MTIEEIFENEELVKIEDELVRIFSQFGPVNSLYGIIKFNEDGRHGCKKYG